LRNTVTARSSHQEYEQAADLIDPLVVAVAEAVEPVADFRFQLEPVQLPRRFSHGK
jgi:hypothetical protein